MIRDTFQELGLTKGGLDSFISYLFLVIRSIQVKAEGSLMRMLYKESSIGWIFMLDNF